MKYVLHTCGTICDLNDDGTAGAQGYGCGTVIGCTLTEWRPDPALVGLNVSAYIHRPSALDRALRAGVVGTSRTGRRVLRDPAEVSQ